MGRNYHNDDHNHNSYDNDCHNNDNSHDNNSDDTNNNHCIIRTFKGSREVLDDYSDIFLSVVKYL